MHSLGQLDHSLNRHFIAEPFYNLNQQPAALEHAPSDLQRAIFDLGEQWQPPERAEFPEQVYREYFFLKHNGAQEANYRAEQADTSEDYCVWHFLRQQCVQNHIED